MLFLPFVAQSVMERYDTSSACRVLWSPLCEARKNERFQWGHYQAHLPIEHHRDMKESCVCVSVFDSRRSLESD